MALIELTEEQYDGMCKLVELTEKLKDVIKKTTKKSGDIKDRVKRRDCHRQRLQAGPSGDL